MSEYSFAERVRIYLSKRKEEVTSVSKKSTVTYVRMGLSNRAIMDAFRLKYLMNLKNRASAVSAALRIAVIVSEHYKYGGRVELIKGSERFELHIPQLRLKGLKK